MSHNIDYDTATSSQIEAELRRRITALRLSRNRTQAQVAADAGISRRTLVRFENGEGVSLDTFVRVVMALELQHRFDTLLPDPAVRPIERVRRQGRERLRARPSKEDTAEGWTWTPEALEDTEE